MPPRTMPGEAESHLEAAPILEDAPVMIWVSNAEAQCIFVNRLWREFSGHQTAQDLDDGWVESLHPEDRDRFAAVWRPAVSDHRAFEAEHRVRRVDGEYRWMLNRGQPLINGVGRFLGYIGALIDITDRKRVETELGQSEQHFRALAENALDLVYRYSLHPEPRVEYVSKAVAAFIGCTPDQIYANPRLVVDAVHPDDRRFVKPFFQTPRTDLHKPVVVRWVRTDGRAVSVEHRRVPVFDADGNVSAVEGIGRDVTDVLAVQERQRQSESLLRQLAIRVQSAREAEKTALSRELHDDLGQVLTAIKLGLTVAKQRCQTPGHPGLVDSLQEVFGHVTLMADRVRRLATGLRPPSLDHHGLREAIELEARAVQRQSGIRCRVSTFRSERRLNDEQRTAAFRVFEEALANVVQHAGASAVRVRLRTTLRVFNLEVKDNGRGIPARKLHDERSLGLLGMQERARLLSGTVEVAGERGKGTTVTLQLPLQTAAMRAARLSRAKDRADARAAR